ncbi:MAG TPA: hypothetical protein VK186_11375 [Candidatus Deferrimicrobium sp.]|nr:hypothetical protein [Candidatus Deferrimicrobium sp.]
MRQLFKTLFSRPAISIIVLLVFFTINGYSRIIANRGESVFAGMTDKDVAVRSNIIDAAGYFLNSSSAFQALLNRIELADTNGGDYKEWAQVCSGAVAHMRNAVAQYLILKQSLEYRPYNPEMIDRLLCFDYDDFQKKNMLTPGIFDEVKSYLGSGDVRGLFEHMLSSTGKILASLTRVKASLDAGVIPELTLLWRLNQDYAEAMLFGQYAAQVFYEIK